MARANRNHFRTQRLDLPRAVINASDRFFSFAPKLG